jgi:hypothetical protein
MTDDFSLARTDRDAWATIRGYVYQIDRTLVSWLKLGPDEFLELEYGEDIDFIGPALAAGPFALKRVLEQVKCLDSNISLRSGAVKEALCSFFQHRQENPGLPLWFRFFTTAGAVAERPPQPLRYTPGIILWERIRTNAIEQSHRVAAIESIGSFLRTLTAPSDALAAVWQEFLRSTEDANQLSFVIERLEWATGEVAAESMAGDVQQLLIDLGHASSIEVAKAQHDQLFVFVMRMLARPKTELPRRLAKQDLSVSLKNTTLSGPEQQILSGIAEFRFALFEKLGGLTNDVASVSAKLDTLLERSTPELLKPIIDTTQTRELLRAASQALLGWPQTTEGRWIERCELDALKTIIRSKPHSCTILLGGPGSGKSALLSRLSTSLTNEGIMLLALKTDRLPQSIGCLSDLDAYLDLKVPLADAVRELAVSQAVVLLVDQLDALAALMDQQTGRLTVMLRLIQILRDVPNVHLIVSCRQFDYKFDTRLASLTADEVVLSDPPFADVERIINEFGISTAGWPEDMREMLRNPQHLNIFLTTFAGEATRHVFDTYESMLEATFQKRVVSQGIETVAACQAIATEMGESEELWIGRAQYDERYPQKVDRLISAGILRQDGRRIAFSHQTVFDYVRTRAFSSGVSSLADLVLQRQNAVFIRSLAWAALCNLRASSFERYCTEFEKLWTSGNLRKHIRSLLITFLGQVQTPDIREAQWLLRLLDDSSARNKVLSAVVGNPAWFGKLQYRFPGLMAEDDQLLLWQLVLLFRAALRFARERTVHLLAENWANPQHDMAVLQTVYDFTDWEEQTVDMVRKILDRQAVNDYFVVHLAKSASKKGSDFGSRLLLAAFDRAVRLRPERTFPRMAEGGTDQSGAPDEQKQEAHRSILSVTDWYGVEEIAEAEPAAFTKAVFPFIVSAAASSASDANPNVVQYRRSFDFRLDLEARYGQGHILEALKRALRRFAETAPADFEVFANESASSELLFVHRLLAYGYERLAASAPLAVLNYLLGDSRRLAVGPYSDQHLESKMLITAAASTLPPEQLLHLERAVARFIEYPNVPDDDTKTRWERRRWNREVRLRLMRAFPGERLSQAAKRQRDEEEIALPAVQDDDSGSEGGIICSPVSAQQMALASDDALLNLFDVLHDNTGSSHPRAWMMGGSYQASQEFAAFAKEHPARAITIIKRFRSNAQEVPAARAIDSLAESAAATPDDVVALIRNLSERGFTSGEFRTSCGRALEKIAHKSGGLSDDVCRLLKSWIQASNDRSGEDEAVEKTNWSDEPRSILWSLGSGGILPHGNYPLLSALQWGYRSRTPAAIDEWLETLSGHLPLPDHARVWRALLRDFGILGRSSKRTRTIGFLTELFERYPTLLPSHEGIVFLAQSIRWLPETFLKNCLSAVGDSEWTMRHQAIGELAMLRIAVDPADAYCRSFVDQALDRTGLNLNVQSRLGVAYSAANLWSLSSFRKYCHPVLMHLVATEGEPIAHALMDVFRVGRIPPDAKTAEFLRAVADRPYLIGSGRPSFLTDRLKELLGDGFDATIIAAVLHSLLNAAGSEIADIRTAWSGDAADLIELSITRLPATRGTGLDIFETLLDLGAYEASQVLREIDKRPM